MNDSTYKDALSIREALCSQLEALERQVALTKDRLQTVDSFIKIYEEIRSGPTVPALSAEQLAILLEVDLKQARQRSELTPRQIADIAREIIVERGAPMTRGALVTAFESRGVPLVGKDKSKNLGTILWRFRDRFTNIEGRGYWPADLPVPE